MRAIAIAVAVLMFYQIMPVVEKFVDAKIKNDSSIATDTRRIADAIERNRSTNVLRSIPASCAGKKLDSLPETCR